MEILEFLGLKKRELVVCLECEHFIPVEDDNGWTHPPACAIESYKSLDYISGKSKMIYEACSLFNSDGRCKRYVPKENVVFKFECAECKHYISSYCGICNASTNITGTEQKVNEPRSVLNADGKCRFFIPSFVDSE